VPGVAVGGDGGEHDLAGLVLVQLGSASGVAPRSTAVRKARSASGTRSAMSVTPSPWRATCSPTRCPARPARDDEARAA
jgi:hypothetical protein